MLHHSVGGRHTCRVYGRVVELYGSRQGGAPTLYCSRLVGLGWGFGRGGPGFEASGFCEACRGNRLEFRVWGQGTATREAEPVPWPDRPNCKPRTRPQAHNISRLTKTYPRSRNVQKKILGTLPSMNYQWKSHLFSSPHALLNHPKNTGSPIHPIKPCTSRQIKGSAIISSHAKSIKVAKNDIQTQLLANPLNTDISRPPNPPPTTMAWLVGNEHAMVATKTSRVGAVNVQGVWRDAALAAPERFLGCVGRQGLWYRPQVLKLLLHCNRSS